MKILRPFRIWFCAFLLSLAIVCAGSQARSGEPAFENYPSVKSFQGALAVPKLVTSLQRTYTSEIQDGVKNGYGVFRDGKEQPGPNFAGDLIVIQWGCGAPCMRMAIADARSGDIYYPPISINGIGASSFDLPLLMVGDSISQNPEVEFRLNSNLMIIKATPDLKRHASYTYYFLWEKHWTLLRRIPNQ
jgi:hypothetical protein